jgi:hypothetical protein
MSALLTVWERLKGLAAVLFPSPEWVRAARGFAPALIWALHVLLVAAALVGLYFLGQYIRSPTWVAGSTFLRAAWLPILVLLCYLLVWLSWVLWKLLGAEEASAFPDIDTAWQQAKAALGREGIALADVPLFLVLGRPEGSEEALFGASELNLSVRGAPGPYEPVRVYGNRDAVFVTCPGASLAAPLAEALAKETVARPGGAEEVSPEEDPTKTVGPGTGPSKGIRVIVGQLEREGRPPSPEEREYLERFAGKGGGALGPAARPPRAVHLLKDDARVQEQLARLKHLCGLIVRDRRPFCPVNGVLLLIPLAATDIDRDADDAGALCRMELAAVGETFRLHCPLFALVCDLERVPGFAAFLEQFGRDDRRRRLGQRFPLVPELEPGQLRPTLDDMVHWVCHVIFPLRVYQAFGLEAAGRDDLPEVLKRNAQLYGLLSEMHGRQKRLSRLLAQAVLTGAGAGDGRGPLLFGGCYLAATGRAADREQAFVPGVFKRLLDEQSAVAWTEAAFAEDEAYRRRARAGVAGLAGLGALVVLALGYSVYLWKS